MKKILSLILLLPLFANAQRPNEIQVRLGYGLAAYQTNASWSYKSGSTEWKYQESDGAVSYQVPIEFRCEINNRFNAGFDMRFGRYLYASDEEQSGKSNQFRILGFGLEGNILNRDNSRIYIGIGGNNAKLVTRELKSDAVLPLYPETTTWTGGGFRFNLGACHFIKSGHFGLNFNAGYDQHNFKLRDVDSANLSPNLGSLSGQLKVSGFEVNMGVMYRFKT